MVPKKRLYISHSLGDSGTDSFECESTGSAHSSLSASSLLLQHHHAHLGHTSLVGLHHHEEPQPQNLSLKKPDRDSRDSSSSFEVSSSSSSQQQLSAAPMASSQQQPKLEPKEEQDDEDEDEDVEDDEDLAEEVSPRMRPYWEERMPLHAAYHHAFLPVVDSSPVKHHQPPARRLLSSASCPSSPPPAAAHRLSMDSSRGGDSGESCPSSPYLMSYQFQEKVEAELANLYKNGLGLCTSPDAATPISIRSFCIQDGNTYRCKVCNNAYTHPSNFHRHYVTTHLQRKSYPCTVCHKKFNRKDNMTAHLRAVHGWGGGGSGEGSVLGSSGGGTVTSSPASASPSSLSQVLPEQSVVN
jgi:hypothetical protein